MTEEQFDLWIEALESGKYKKGRFQLGTYIGDGKLEYCCLGVANKIFDLKYPDYFGTLYDPHTKEASLIPLDLQIEIASENDSSETFEQVIRYLKMFKRDIIGVS